MITPVSEAKRAWPEPTLAGWEDSHSYAHPITDGFAECHGRTAADPGALLSFRQHTYEWTAELAGRTGATLEAHA